MRRIINEITVSIVPQFCHREYIDVEVSIKVGGREPFKTRVPFDHDDFFDMFDTYFDFIKNTLKERIKHERD